MRRIWCLLAVAGVLICAAGCGTREPSHGQRASATAAPDRTAAATAGPTAAPASSPLSGSFLMDLTWISDQRGWALAAAPCGPGLCPRLAATVDGGRTWTALPAPPGGGAGPGGCGPAACVSQVRFATATVGYLFGPALYQTSDGGRTWRRVPGRPVESLEPSAGTVVRVSYDHTGCPGPCDRVVQETTAGSAIWHTLLRIPPARADFGVAAQVVRQGTSVIDIPVYGHVAGGAGRAYTVIFRSTDGGVTWQRLDDPCAAIGPQEHDTRGLAAAPGGFTAVLCTPRGGTGVTFVRTSTGNGSWGPPHPVPGGTAHHLALIAGASAAHLVLATDYGSPKYRLVASADGGLHWSTVLAGTSRFDPRAPAAPFLGFEDTRTGRWISDSRHIWTTRDAGRRWREQAFP